MSTGSHVNLLVNKQLSDEYSKNKELQNIICQSGITVIETYELTGIFTGMIIKLKDQIFNFFYSHLKNRNIPDLLIRFIIKYKSWYSLLKGHIPQEDIIHCIFGDNARNGCFFLSIKEKRKIIVEITSNRLPQRVFKDHIRVIFSLVNTIRNLYIRAVSETVYENSISILPQSFFNSRGISFTFYRGAFINISSKLVEKQKENIIIFPHRFIEPKNVILFSHVIKDMLDEDKLSGWRIYFRGKGPLESEIRNILTDYISNGTVEVGFTYRLSEELAKTKIFISIISTGNYNSNSMYEAMRNGNILLLSDTGITRKYLPHPDIIYTKTETLDLRDKILAAVRLSESPDFPVKSKAMQAYFDDIRGNDLYMIDLFKIYNLPVAAI